MTAAAEWYASTDPELAAKWFNGLMDAMQRIARDAESFPLARESNELPVQVRQLLYGLGKRKTHRILFAVRPTQIIVHQVRHVSQRDMEQL